MKKRYFVILVLLAAAAVISAAALHQGKTPGYTVGICQYTQHEALDAAAQGFKAALSEKLGKQVTYDEQNAGADSSVCNAIMNSFLAEEADLILADSTKALQAAANATTEIPILGTAVTDYGAALNLSDFGGTVGGNISGTSDLAAPGEQAVMIHELFPEAETVGILYCSSETNSQFQAEGLTDALTDLGYHGEAYPFVDSGDLAAVTAQAASACDILYVPTDNTVASNAELIANICIPENVPVITGDENTCRICGAATLSVNYYDLGYATGEMAAEILSDGKPISEMPVRYADSYMKKYNPSVCEKLGLTVPEDYIPLDEQ